jgi:hypothetical protein
LAKLSIDRNHTFGSFFDGVWSPWAMASVRAF